MGIFFVWGGHVLVFFLEGVENFVGIFFGRISGKKLRGDSEGFWLVFFWISGNHFLFCLGKFWRCVTLAKGIKNHVKTHGETTKQTVPAQTATISSARPWLAFETIFDLGGKAGMVFQWVETTRQSPYSIFGWNL